MPSTRTILRCSPPLPSRPGWPSKRPGSLAAERQRADELDALRTTMADITAELELSTLLQAIVERAAGLLECHRRGAGPLRRSQPGDPDRGQPQHGQGLCRHTPSPRAKAPWDAWLETGEPLIIGDYQAWEGRAAQYAGIPTCTPAGCAA